MGRRHGSFILRAVATTALCVLYGLGCGSGNSNVSGQGDSTITTVSLQARILSGVAKDQANVECAETCEYTYTAGVNQTTKSHQTFSALPLKCNAEGTPETDQGFDAKFTFDPNDQEVLEGGMIEVTCCPPGGSLVDEATFNLLTINCFTDSVVFNAQECLRDQAKCLISAKPASLWEQVNNSGITGLLSSLKCPALDLIGSSCTNVTTPTSFCSTLELIRSQAGCPPASSGAVCGDGKVSGNEPCDPGANKTDPSDDIVTNCPFKPVPVGTTCAQDCSGCEPPRTTCKKGSQPCTLGRDCSPLGSGYICKEGCCTPPVTGSCGDGTVDVATELCDVGNGAPNTCPIGTCDPGSCRCCGDGICDTAFGEFCPEDCGGGGPVCGDGICRTDQCEHSDTDVGCPADCHCGNGVTEPLLGEECDDGNSREGDGCSSTCKRDSTCGNGIIEPIACEGTKCPNPPAMEYCDPPQSPIPGSPLECCTRFCDGGAPCHEKVCGDGLCDGGELENLQNCRKDCHYCGDGYCDADESIEFCKEDCGCAAAICNGLPACGPGGACPAATQNDPQRHCIENCCVPDCSSPGACGPRGCPSGTTCSNDPLTVSDACICR